MELKQLAYIQFINALHSKHTKENYKIAIDSLSKYAKLDYDQLIELEPKKAQAMIIQYIVEELKENRKLSPGTIRTYVAGIRTFFDINDAGGGINWKNVKRYVGEFYLVGEDRPYTREEIKKLLDSSANLRDKAIILLLASSGMRRGALPPLKLKHLKVEDKYNIFVIEVYKQSREHYYTFCTPEARKAIQEYVEWRARLGEKITPESPLFRADFNTRYNARTPVKPITEVAIRETFRKLRKYTNVVEVKPLTESVRRGSHRSKIKIVHGFRKFFDTTCTNGGMNPLFIELLMGHDIGLKRSYYKPQLNEVLEGTDRTNGYVSVINDLTINEENRLRRQVAKLTVDSDKFARLEAEMKKLRELVES